MIYYLYNRGFALEVGYTDYGPSVARDFPLWPATSCKYGVRCRRRRILLALALSCQGCGLQNWRLWRLRRLCSVMAGGTARPAAAEGEAGHEPGTGWPGPQVAALGRGARAHGRPRGARPRGSAYGVPPRCRDGGPAFPAIISSVQSKEALDRPCYGVSQTCHRSSSHVPWFLHGFRSFAIWSCGCVFRD